MTRDANLSDQLALYALGMLDAEESAAVERALAHDAALQSELQDILAVTGDLAASALVVAAPQRIGNRLMSSVGAGRFETFVLRIATLFDVSIERARQLMAGIDQLSSWVAGPAPQISFYHFNGGPAFIGADCGFVRVAAGSHFPWHLHEGEEVSLVLEGGSRDHEGKQLHAGDEMRLSSGTSHDFVALDETDYLYAVRVYGVRFDISKPTK